MSVEEGELFFKRCTQLEKICKENAEYWALDNSTTGKRLCEELKRLLDHLKPVKVLTDEISTFASEYDFDENTPGNGYRSIITAVTSCIEHTLEICQALAAPSSNGGEKQLNFFQKGSYTKDIQSYIEILDNLGKSMRCVLTLRSWSDKGDLFPAEAHTTSELFSDGDFDQLCFFGRCVGFQFCASIRRALRFISFSMATYSELYYARPLLSPRTALLLPKTIRYMFDSDMRARRIVSISQNADVQFCKSFWFLNETDFMAQLPKIFGSKVQVNRIVKIPPEPLRMQKLDSQQFVDIPIPESHLGPKCVTIRLVSSKYREGMIGRPKGAGKPYQVANNLIIHCHGGGFVSQNSKSHEMYLRGWADQLDTPIVSIDYSLAPEAPFPRASEEVFYTYCWALKNRLMLGTMAEKIVLVGDSAGANLNVGIALKCIEFGIRKPDGLFIAYCPFLVSFVPSPSRLLCMMDPLLPFGFMMRCLKAYVSPDTKTSDSSHIPLNLKVSQTAESISRTICKLSRSSSPTLDDREHASQNSASENVLSDLPFRNEERTETIQSLKERTSSLCSSSITSNIFDFTSYVVRQCESRIRKKFAIFQRITNLRISKEDVEEAPSVDHNFSLRSLSDEFNFIVPGDPLMSPYLASDDYLRHLPPSKILTTEMDPCLDDCVMVAKKLKKLGVPVTLDIIKGVPHGFLNLSKVSKECDAAAELSANRIGELLNS